MKTHDEWLADRSAREAAHRARQLDVSDLVSRTIIGAKLTVTDYTTFDSKLTLTFSDGTVCSFEGEGCYDKVTEDLWTSVVRLVDDE